MKKILENKFIQFGIVLAVGIAIGTIFYPTKNIEKEIEKKYQAEKTKLIEDFKTINNRIEKEKTELSQKVLEIQSESQNKISSLRIENNSLKQKVKERKLKIVKPDGTVVEESYKESETEAVSKVITDVRQEFNTKVKSIENKWKNVHEKRVIEIKEKYESKLQEKEQIIASMRSKEKIQVNPRQFSLAFGIMTDNQYYSNISYDVYGPWFLNLQVESDKQFQEGSGGIGLGWRF